MTGRFALRRMAIVTAVVLLGAAAAAQQGKPKPTDRLMPGFDETSAWFRLAAAHESGAIDASLRTLASWPAWKLYRVRHDLRLIALLMDNAMNGGGIASLPPVREDEFSIGRLAINLHDLIPLLGLPESAFGLRQLDPRAIAHPASSVRRLMAVLMAKGAVLHTDLMLAAAEEEVRLGGPAGPATSSTAIRILDGQRSETASTGIYWQVARLAMDEVIVTPRGREFVPEWYHATFEFLLARREYDSGVPHADHGRRTLRTDARMAFYEGVALENLTAPRVQTAIAQNPGTARLDPRPTMLKRAEAAFGSALKLDPALIEARLRLAHVMLETQRPDQAAAVLEQVETTLDRPELRYFAALFLGRAYEARDRETDARAAFERARALFPEAQSPSLALARLAWRAADTPGATANLRALGNVRRTDAIDPWWIYDVSPAVDLSTRLAAARTAFDRFLREP